MTSRQRAKSPTTAAPDGMAEALARFAEQPGIPMVEIGPGLAFPARLRPMSRDVNGYRVTVEIVPVPEEGRLVIRSMQIEQGDGGSPVDARALRAIPVASILRDVMDEHMRHLDAKGFMLHADPAEVRALGIGSDEALQAVAAEFARAHAVGNEPTKAVVDRFDLKRDTAVRWINRARERGFLSEAQRSRRGQHGER